MHYVSKVRTEWQLNPTGSRIRCLCLPLWELANLPVWVNSLYMHFWGGEISFLLFCCCYGYHPTESLHIPMRRKREESRGQEYRHKYQYLTHTFQTVGPFKGNCLAQGQEPLVLIFLGCLLVWFPVSREGNRYLKVKESPLWPWISSYKSPNCRLADIIWEARGTKTLAWGKQENIGSMEVDPVYIPRTQTNHKETSVFVPVLRSLHTKTNDSETSFPVGKKLDWRCSLLGWKWVHRQFKAKSWNIKISFKIFYFKIESYICLFFLWWIP